DRCEMNDELRLGVGEQPRGVVGARQVVLGAARDDDVVPLLLEAFDDVRAEEAGAAGDECPHALAGVAAAAQSTRPTQRWRFSAYQRIVCRTPSSHETAGCQPVSRASFSKPTRSAITSLAPGR